MVYEVRGTTNSNDPADRGGWWRFFQTYRGAFRCWQQMNAELLGVRGSERGLATRGAAPPQRNKGNARTSSIARGGNSLLAP